ncbi:hypothetical protein [Kribbella antiqua]|uniref:hypothetical protein n=1 Tax=Kribbella antiqua TaxID=2512217 RepID=UPI0013054286|nr:hypothetical protein [Kribbella antiqua]
MRDRLDAVNDGVGAPCAWSTKRKSWLEFALDPAPGLAGVDLENAVFKSSN